MDILGLPGMLFGHQDDSTEWELHLNASNLDSTTNMVALFLNQSVHINKPWFHF